MQTDKKVDTSEYSGWTYYHRDNVENRLKLAHSKGLRLIGPQERVNHPIVYYVDTEGDFCVWRDNLVDVENRHDPISKTRGEEYTHPLFVVENLKVPVEFPYWKERECLFWKNFRNSSSHVQVFKTWEEQNEYACSRGYVRMDPNDTLAQDKSFYISRNDGQLYSQAPHGKCGIARDVANPLYIKGSKKSIVTVQLKPTSINMVLCMARILKII